LRRPHDGQSRIVPFSSMAMVLMRTIVVPAHAEWEMVNGKW
jgi:hypothetical protein